ncbi:GNAT family N-acetyltransferase [Maledivibacter halophilus]|uniref:Acetyltransferases, including N-acetylases of ribosomal proteins n=1 Tax=Maledivibacter halophilus TaxID=36842 RepID=A0A1T5M124_9FIRM|nr:GNAT family N-acetyltransferase [Maledivibacter halophilus]SKC81927.1 Acetyltransferases, including N-acetylases of ribosomal proteins [Maledivibacter halophilus]
MQFIEVNRDNADILFDYWNEIRKNIPYFYRTTYKLFIKSLFDDTYEGRTVFRTNNVFGIQEDGQVKGVIQYDIPTFHFTEVGKITKDINIGVILNLYYEETRIDIGRVLLDLSLDFFKENNIKDIYAFYHAMGMSCNGNHGKLHEEYNYVGKLLCEEGFEIEHENIYYICDMKEKKLEYQNNRDIRVSELEDNKQKFILYDEDNKALGSAEIKYIDNLTGSSEKDIIYLVWIDIDKKVKGKGLGTEFLNHIIQYCLKKGYRYLHTDTALNNKIAQKFYIRNGFIDNGITRSYLTKTSS